MPKIYKGLLIYPVIMTSTLFILEQYIYNLYQKLFAWIFFTQNQQMYQSFYIFLSPLSNWFSVENRTNEKIHVLVKTKTVYAKLEKETNEYKLF